VNSKDDLGWRAIDRRTFDALTSSNSTQLVPKAEWPDIALRMEASGESVAQVWAWSPTSDTGVLEVVRESSVGGSTMWKRDRWYLAETSDGDTMITRRPDKDIEGRSHHSTVLPPWPLRDPPSSG
jgi:hypothetical protein